MKLHGNARQAGRLSHALQSGQRGVTLVFLTLLALGAARTSSAAPSAQPAPAAADLLATPTGLTPEPKADPPPVPDQARPIGQVKPSPLSAQPGYHAVMAQQRSKFCQNASVKAGAKGGLAACKQSFDAGTGVGPMLMSAQPGCPVPGSPVQTYDAAGHVAYSQVFSVPAGAHLTVWTESMTQVGAPFATTVPDTLLYLLRCDDLSCGHGAIVAINDDGNPSPQPYDSKLDLYGLPNGYYRWVVTSYAQGHEGQTMVGTQVNNAAIWWDSALVFGGQHSFPPEIRPGDVLMVGKNNNTFGLTDPAHVPQYPAAQADPEYADTTLFVMSTNQNNCESGACGEFWFNDDAWPYWTNDPMLLSRVLIPVSGAGMTNPRVLVGSYRSWYAPLSPTQAVQTINTRLIHIRRHTSSGGNWSCDEQLDRDRDELPAEVEASVGSCDSAGDAPADGVGARRHTCGDWGSAINSRVNYWYPGTNCSVPATVPPNAETCWSPVDSDNDGVRDLWEVFGAVASFPNLPVGPDTDAGAPTPVSIFEPIWTCPTVWCAAYDFSALSDPDPGVYDINAQFDHYVCTGSHCAVDYAAGAGSFAFDHRLTATQQTLLKTIWTDQPGSCWDGSQTWPCGNEIDNSLDLPYRTRLHAYDAKAINLPGPVRGVEGIRGGTGEVASWYNHSFRASWKFLRLFRYGLLADRGGQAQSGPGALAIMGNTHVTVADEKVAAAQVISHETGHTLTLNHPHDNRNIPATGPGQTLFVVPGQCASGMCAQDPTCQCEPGQNTCPVGQDNLAETNKPNNPAASTLMSYRYQWGMSAPGTLAPTGGVAGNCPSWCSQDNARFSKGLGRSIDEVFLREQVTVDWSGNPPKEGWRTVKQVQDLQCYNHAGDNKGCAPFGPTPPQGIQGPSVPGPACNAASFPTVCVFDWNFSYSTDANPMSFDLSRGKFHYGASCARDLLTDVDEVGRVVAISRANLAHSQKKQYAIYQDVFNGTTQPFNYAGWPSQVIQVANVALTQAEYRRNQCAAGAACAGGACLTDACTAPTTCKLQGATCNNGKCSCAADNDCWSGICDGGSCSGLGLGTCACAQNADCSFLPGQNPVENRCIPQPNVPHACDTKRSAGAMGPLGDERMWESAEFAGNSHITLEGGSQTPLGSVATTDEFQFVLDIFWRGFGSGQSTQVVVDSAFAKMWLAHDSDGQDRIRTLVYAGTSPVLASTVSVKPGVWYRVKWSSSSNAVLSVQARDLVTGWFDPSLASCGYKSMGTVDILAATAFRIGMPLSGSEPGFRGRVDNVNLFNYSFETPEGCPLSTQP